MYREEYSTITARYPDNRIRAVIAKKEDGRQTSFKLDMSKPVTLKRMQEVVQLLKNHTGLDFPYLKVNHTVYEYEDCGLTPAEIDEYVRAGDYVPCTKTVDKTYEYFTESNTLRIWDRDEPIYENANGTITDDRVALADCLM